MKCSRRMAQICDANLHKQRAILHELLAEGNLDNICRVYLRPLHCIELGELHDALVFLASSCLEVDRAS